MMRKMLAATLAGLAGLALAGSAALAQDASTVQVAPTDSVTTTTPDSTTQGFDKPQPQPALTLAAPADAAALRGLKPGQDLVGEDHSHTGSQPAAATDSYFATKDYQQKAETIERKGHQSAARQFAGAGEAAAANLAIGGVGLMINGN